jgi:hypothetical protein
MELLELTFRSFWHFLGMTIILNGAAYFVVNGLTRLWTKFMRMLMVRKHGWPPEHLDADGDWKD